MFDQYKYHGFISSLFGGKTFKSCSRGNPALQALLNWEVMVGNIGVIYLENCSPAGNVSAANYRKNPFNQWCGMQARKVAGGGKPYFGSAKTLVKGNFHQWFGQCHSILFQFTNQNSEGESLFKQGSTIPNFTKAFIDTFYILLPLQVFASLLLSDWLTDWPIICVNLSIWIQ